MKRRSFIAGSVLVAAARSRAATTPTPAQTRGPFYPLEPPLEHDSDLVRVDGHASPARGTVLHLAGRVLDLAGRPVQGALVEIWQCDANGRYHHPWDRGGAARDAGFQGYGTHRAGAGGAYRFRTIRPVPYPGRTPHIHFAVTAPGADTLVTQMYVRGEPGNRRDVIYNRLPEPLRDLVTVALEPRAGSPGDLEARFDIVIGA